MGTDEGKGRMALQSNHQNAHGQSGRYAGIARSGYVQKNYD